jgi:hypothetical protein
LARRALTVIAMSLVVLLFGGTASALAGPGAILKQQGGDPQPVPGSAIAANANTGGTYTHREFPGERGMQITLRGLSISGLLSLAGFNPRAVSNIAVVGGDGPLITLTGPEINNPPFPQGPALISDSGGTTTFFKPARTGDGTSSLVKSVPGTPLEIQVDGGSLLSVEVTANPTTAKVGQPITFKARVRFAPPGASFTFTWNFDDGEQGSGQQVTHAFKYSSDFQPLVQVEGTGGSGCSPRCGGPGRVRVVITGEKREPDQAPGTPNGGGTGGTGSGGSGTGSGSGDGTSGPAGSGRGSGARKPPALRAERPESDERFSADPTSGAGKTVVQGILLAGSGATIEGGLPGGASAGSAKPATGVTGTADERSTLLICVALALACVLLGALRERRNVRLRVA